MLKFYFIHKYNVESDIYGANRHNCLVFFAIYVSVTLNDDRNHSIYSLVCNDL